MNYILKYVSIIALFGLFSCSRYTEPTALKQTTKANDKYPESIAKLVRSWYPCTTTETNTVIEKRDSIIYIDCPDLPVIVHEPNDTIYLDHAANNTVYSPQIKTVRVPVHLPIEIRYITKWVEDSAKIFVLTNDLKTLVKKADDLQVRVDTMTDKRDYWRVRFFVLLAGIVIYFIIKIYLGRFSKPFSTLKNLIP